MAELTALSSRKGRAIATFSSFDVSQNSHGSATRFLRNGNKYYIFIDNLLLFPTVKEL